jgi:hypothetical protein
MFFFSFSKHVLWVSSICLRCWSSFYGVCLCDVEGLCAMSNFKKRKRLNEVEHYPVKAESSYFKVKSRCAKMAAELEQVSLRLHLTESMTLC